VSTTGKNFIGLVKHYNPRYLDLSYSRHLITHIKYIVQVKLLYTQLFTDYYIQIRFLHQIYIPILK